MSDQNKLTMFFITCVVVVVIALFSCIYDYNVKNDQNIVKMVQAGADPIAAACAMKGHEHICRYTKK